MLVEGDYYESLADHEKAASTYRALFELFPDSVEYGLLCAASQGLAGHTTQGLETVAQLRQLPKPASDDPRIDLQQARFVINKEDGLVLERTAQGKATAQGKKLVYASARRHECLDAIFSGVANPERGIALCEEAYNIFLAAGNRLEAGDTVRRIADLQASVGHREQSIATYQRALKMLLPLGEHEKTGAVLANLGIIFMNDGKLDRAERLSRQAKAHFEQAGDTENAAVAVESIADIFYLLGNLPAAANTYQQALDLVATLDQDERGYPLLRLADLELAQGRVKDAHRHAQQSIDSYPPNSYDVDAAMTELGTVLEAEADLKSARREFEATLSLQQKMNKTPTVVQSQVKLAELAMEEDHPEQAEPLLRTAFAEFEKEKSDLDAADAYIVLSRALLMQGKLEEARKAIQRAAELGRSSPDPALKLPTAIQNARIEIASAGQGAPAKTALAAARRQLHSVIATARKLGYYTLECEARLALGELELKANPALGRSLLKELADEAGGRGLQLISRKASDLGASRSVIAAAAR